MRAAALSLLLLCSCTAYVAPGAADPILALKGDPVQGQVLFDKNCADCHGKDGRKRKDVSLPDDAAKDTDAQIIDNILAGPSIMPSFAKKLSAAQIADITAWLKAGLPANPS